METDAEKAIHDVRFGDTCRLIFLMELSVFFRYSKNTTEIN